MKIRRYLRVDKEEKNAFLDLDITLKSSACKNLVKYENEKRKQFIWKISLRKWVFGSLLISFRYTPFELP